MNISFTEMRNSMEEVAVEGRHEESTSSILNMLNLKLLKIFKLSYRWLTLSSKNSEEQFRTEIELRIIIIDTEGHRRRSQNEKIRPSNKYGCF